MAQWHLDNLENEIVRNRWRVISRLEGNDYDISASWVIERGITCQIDFDGLDDLNTLSIERAYACRIKDTRISLYFYKKGDNWKNGLAKFITKLNELDKKYDYCKKPKFRRKNEKTHETYSPNHFFSRVHLLQFQ